MTGSPTTPSFSLDFPTPDEAQWRAIAEAGLKGAAWDRLVGRTADGLPLQPLYRESDCATASDPTGAPGVAPFVRGASAARDPYGPWSIRQSFMTADAAAANAEILADLEGGVASVEIATSAAGETGWLARALQGVMFDLAPVSLDAGAGGFAAAEALGALLPGNASAPAFNLDPLGCLMRDGAMATGDIERAAGLARTLAAKHPSATFLRCDARPVHEAGGSEAQELGAALAAGAAYLRALTEAGFDLAAAGKALLFTVAVGPDVLVETAKLRALRLCWARVMEASGAKPADRAARIHAVTSRRMMTRRDSHTNMLRTTAAAFAAAVGGADAITVLPFTDAIGLPTPFGRRIARNTQIILMEECRLGHVIDPAGGAWFVEKMTRDLAGAAWEAFQKIEAAGGLAQALKAGALQADVAAVRARREKAVATRRENVTGVTDFPLLGAAAPAVAGPTPPAPAAKGDVTAAPLVPLRWSARFEALCDAGEAAGAKAFFATLGPLAEFSARSNFARNLLGAGGIAAIGPEDVHADHAAMAAAFKASGARIAILCGADPRYATEAAAAAGELKKAGALWVAYAGKPADEAGLRAAGVDQFVMAGQDALEALGTLHAALGIGK